MHHRMPQLAWVLFMIAGLGLSGPVMASPLKIKKGPILHYTQGKLQVRMQGKFKQPRVEWRRGAVSESIPMKPTTKRFWRAALPAMDGKYRIADGNRMTSWIPILNQKEDPENLRFVVYGSNLTGLGHSPIHKNLLKAVQGETPSLILHTGGLVAEGGRKRFWNQFFQEGKATFRSIPLQPVIGMTDRSKTGAFAKNFHGGANEKTRYHFTYGPAHFIALDTTRNFKPGSEQYLFLRNTLESIRGASPIIIYFYHPAFSASVIGGDEKVLKYLVPLFEEFGVDLVIAGQEHGYQRLRPVNGVTYIITGGGGAYPTPISDDPNLASYHSLYHYMVFEVDGQTVRGKMKGVQGALEDSFEWNHRLNPVPREKRKKRPEMKRSRRYKYAAPY